LIEKPGKNYFEWFRNVQQKFGIKPYVQIDNPNKFVMQVRYQTKDHEILLFNNSNMNAAYRITINPSSLIYSGRQAWLWDPEHGERFKLSNSQKINLQLEASDLKMIVFDKEQNGVAYSPPSLQRGIEPNSAWTLTGNHIDGSTRTATLDHLKDLKEDPEWMSFCGTIIYHNNFIIDDRTKIEWLDLGKVYGVADVSVNGQRAGVKWYGGRVFPIKHLLKNDNNEIEVKVVTTMVNYMKSLTSNTIAQYWTNQGKTTQPLQSTGLIGPVRIF
jgi:hypothetical protein